MQIDGIQRMHVANLEMEIPKVAELEEPGLLMVPKRTENIIWGLVGAVILILGIVSYYCFCCTKCSANNCQTFRNYCSKQPTQPVTKMNKAMERGEIKKALLKINPDVTQDNAPPSNRPSAPKRFDLNAENPKSAPMMKANAPRVSTV